MIQSKNRSHKARFAAVVTAIMLSLGGVFATAVPASAATHVSVYLSCQSNGKYSWTAVGTGFTGNGYYSTWYDTSYTTTGGNGGSWDQGEVTRRASAAGTVSTPTYYGDLGDGAKKLTITYYIGTKQGSTTCTF